MLLHPIKWHNVNGRSAVVVTLMAFTQSIFSPLWNVDKVVVELLGRANKTFELHLTSVVEVNGRYSCNPLLYRCCCCCCCCSCCCCCRCCCCCSCCCCCCCCSSASLSEQARSPEEKQTVSREMPQVKWAAYGMLCSNVRECGTVGHSVYYSATVCADFVDGIICSLSVSCQSSVMSATKPAEVYSVRTW